MVVFSYGDNDEIVKIIFVLNLPVKRGKKMKRRADIRNFNLNG